MAAQPSHHYIVLDVFTGAPLAGNPLAVFTEGHEIPSRLMQAAALELNLSETVFLLPGDSDADATVRIFTPAKELSFAGHPVLGSAFVVGASGDRDVVRLRTGMGIVPVTLTREHREIVYGEMVQPRPTIAPAADASALLKGLGLSRSEFPVEVYDNGPKHAMVVVDSVDALVALETLPTVLRNASEFMDLTTISCFTKVADGCFKTRVFCPGAGVIEDPATGSAAGPLALHAVRHGLSQIGQQIEIVQGVEIHRPSELNACVDGSVEHPEIAVGGQAVTVAHGHFRLA
jgi:trans-2,3-dihydro-3-hydroxyanthranilate isomerase